MIFKPVIKMKKSSIIRKLGIAINLLMGLLFAMGAICQEAKKDEVINELKAVSERFRDRKSVV